MNCKVGGFPVSRSSCLPIIDGLQKIKKNLLPGISQQIASYKLVIIIFCHVRMVCNIQIDELFLI